MSQSNLVTDVPLVQNFPGYRTPFGLTLPPGGRVAAYVRSTGAQSGDDITIGNNLVLTSAAAFARCRSGMGDTVVYLPGHTETVTATFLSALLAHTNLIGIGRGTSMPVFNFSATDSQFALSVANCYFHNLKFNFSANGVVKGWDVSGSDNWIDSCTWIVASGATAKATIVCELNTGADRFRLTNNRVYGTATHNVTNGFLVTAAVTDCEFINNRMIASATAGNGLINFVGASLNNLVAGNLIYNTHTSSTTSIAVADAASDGFAVNNRFGAKVGTATAPAVTGLVFAGASSLWTCNENYSTPTKNTSGLVTPAVDS